MSRDEVDDAAVVAPPLAEHRGAAREGAAPPGRAEAGGAGTRPRERQGDREIDSASSRAASISHGARLRGGPGIALDVRARGSRPSGEAHGIARCRLSAERRSGCASSLAPRSDRRVESRRVGGAGTASANASGRKRRQRTCGSASGRKRRAACSARAATRLVPPTPGPKRQDPLEHLHEQARQGQGGPGGVRRGVDQDQPALAAPRPGHQGRAVGERRHGLAARSGPGSANTCRRRAPRR